MDPQKIVVTAALPYANGSIHIGHLLEYIQGDIFARFLKLIGKDALYICASDMHGTPIQVNAKKAGIDPEEFVEMYWQEHQKDIASFLVHFDNFYKTHSPENKELAELFFSTLKQKGLISLKEIEQMYDEEAKQFLPDRFVKGKCPKCKAEDQYGDVCESCGAAYNTSDLINPYSVLTKSKPVLKKSNHYFFKLSKMSRQLQRWIKSHPLLQPEMVNFVQQWLDEGLQDWCISRDAPYFGFEIPNSKEEAGAPKYFYVWLDAPIGYISSTKNYCDANGKSWDDYWKKGDVYHVLGKDITYFHFLFWPAMLMAMDIPIPRLTVHGFITVNGQKMSKSRGTFFTAQEFLEKFDPEALRFYYASHLDRKVIDVDLNFTEFQAVVNNVLMGNLGNFCYRTLTFAQKNYGEITKTAAEPQLVSELEKLFVEIKQNYQDMDFKTAVKNIMKAADIGNAYFQKAEPWKKKENEAEKEEARAAVGFCVNIARNLAIICSPILPEFSRKIFSSLNQTGRSETSFRWVDLSFHWKGRIEEVQKLVEKIEELPQRENFSLSIKAGQIVEVKNHPNADSLYLMQVDFGSQKKQVVAGLKKYFTSEQLQGKKALFLMNLKPVKIRGEKSEAMTLVADDGQILALLEVDAPLGSQVSVDGLAVSEAEIGFDEFQKVNLVVEKGRVVYKSKVLKAAGKEIAVTSVKDGAKIG